MYDVDVADVYDEVYALGVGKDYSAEAAALADIIHRRCPGATRLLDVACGTGAHLAHFREHFAQVAGVELSEPMRRRAQARLPEVPIHAGDMRSFDLGATFDAVTCLFSSIGYMGSVAELRAAAERFAVHLNPGGVLVLEPWLTPEQWRPGYVSHTVSHSDTRTSVRMSFSAQRGPRTSVLQLDHLVGEEGVGVRHFTEEHVLTLFTTSEYEQALAAAGLAEIGGETGWSAGRDRIVARRPW